MSAANCGMSDNRRAALKLRRRLIRLLVTIILLSLASPFICGVVFITGLVRVPCSGSVDPASYGLDYEPITFPVPEFGRDFRGYWIPAQREDRFRADATIIAVPTSWTGIADRLHETIFYTRAGYDVLAFESVSCAGVGVNSLGYREIPTVGAALAYLDTRSDAEAERVALHGFSSGGALALMAAAQYPAVDAVVAQGGYANLAENVQAASRAFYALAPLFEIGTALGYRLNVGAELTALNARAAIEQIAPRPVLLIYGTGESSYPNGLSLLVGDHVTLWGIDGAGHGGYVQAAPEAYGQRIVAFMDAAFGVERGT